MRDPDAELGRLHSESRAADLTEEIIMREQFDEVVQAALIDLPPKHRQVLELVDIDGLSYAEAAQLLDVPEGTVMSRVHRARKRIRACLAASDIAPRRKM